MPIEVRRFGVGHRRPEGPAGTSGLTGQVLHSDGRGAINELAFARGGRVEPHSSPNPAFFVVIEGGGWVLVGDETTRVAAGEAVVWPADVVHAAWTEHSQMRAFVVEFAASGETGAGILEGEARPALPAATPVARGEGQLASPPRPLEPDPSSGEPR
ncbi:MAG: cupin domain-containing protein [Chloroflexota bacterium]